MPNVNQGLPIRLEANGVIQLVDGVTEYDIFALEPGTVEIHPGFYEPLTYKDRGEQQPPLEGDEQLSTVRLTLKLTTLQASEVYAILTSRASDGKMKLFSFVAKWKDTKHGGTYEVATIANCFLSNGAPVIRTSDRFDLLEIEMMSIEPLPAISTEGS